MFSSVKLFCGLAIFVCAVFFGLKIRKKYASRLNFYEELNRFLSYLREQIAYIKAPLTKIAADYSLTAGEAIKRLVLTLGRGGYAEAAPQYLTGEEKAEVDCFVGRLGKSDLDSQLRLIDEFRTRISASLKKAEKEKKDKGELGFKLATLGGIAVAILLA